MKFSCLILFAVVSTLLIDNVLAQERTQISVNRIAIARDVVELEPVEPGTTFSNETQKLFCFTHITGAESETTITHHWVYNDTLSWDVKLPVGSKSWRTYSSKNFVKEWTGEWNVLILDEAGNELKRIKFELTKTSGN